MCLVLCNFIKVVSLCIKLSPLNKRRILQNKVSSLTQLYTIISESGGVFTFGKSKFAENLPNKFWIRNDEVTQVACGDQHTVLYAGKYVYCIYNSICTQQLSQGFPSRQHTKSCICSLFLL